MSIFCAKGEIKDQFFLSLNERIFTEPYVFKIYDKEKFYLGHLTSPGHMERKEKFVVTLDRVSSLG